MSAFFLRIVNMSISASWIVLAVLLLRFVLKKAPKWITVLLWGIVAVRLICPFTVESVMSLIPSAETINPNIMTEKTPEVHTGIPILNHTINSVISGSLSPDPGDSANPLQIWIPILSAIWITGILLLLAYAAISFWRVKRKVGTAVLLRSNLYQSETVMSPFVFGIIKPKIYLPFHISKQDMEHVISHEQAHIRRKDHWWKPFGFLLLALHWFNPFMWLGYILLCRDIELACDEKVIIELDRDQKADYAQALLTCSVNRRMISACPLAFGEVGVKSRVKSVLNYRKPAFWIMIAAILASIAVAVCFLTNPKTPEFKPDFEGMMIPDTEGIYTDYAGVYLTVNSIDTDADGYEMFHLIWHNDTEQQITYGEMYTIEFKDGDEWKGVMQDEIAFTAIGYLLNPYSTANKSYTTQWFDLSKNGTYRLRSDFSTGDGNHYHTWIEFEVREAEINADGSGDSSDVVPSTDIEQLKAKFPMYFGLDGMKGLELYIWQMSPNTYWCGLLDGRNVGHSQAELWGLKPASMEEMRTIINDYITNGKVTRDEVFIVPIQKPISSYAYTIDEAYYRKLNDLFWEEGDNQ